ncbi:protein far1-related sequence 6 [Phtheirospermum japonicum]|uniref:Protein FAR1-RELATED SEQUENCE n=1 Tax=Phtheirospermum japonicum TaxID=374723 RepID=A0A830BZE2_9LAMI|nr:protein far1-related sequence 6 [Phtheirospermum japonicum]
MDEVSLNSEPTFDDEADEFEIDGECSMTEYIGQTGNILQGENPLPPSVGMEFESYDDVYFFYNCYAKQQGFGVRVSNTWYRKSKERYRGKLSCSSAGFKKKTEAHRPRPETRTGCPAMIKFRLMENKRWRIIEIELDHNHLTSPISANSCKSHRIVDLGSKRPLLADEARKTRLFRTVVIDTEDNGILNVDEGGINKLKLKKGDAREMLEFFTRMQLGNSSFFYVMDVNEKGCLRNVFWADARCRAAYIYFGDVLFIDTKSLINKYEFPFVVFTGVNQHGQSLPLGCGLVLGSSVESFIWLFRAWLTYMVGRAPQTVITSECKFMQTAIAEVFPRAFHCFDLNNIMKRVLSELSGEKTMQSYRLTNLKLIQTLYEDRRRWVPVYLKEVFLAGMFPIKENERLISPFEEYLSQHTSLKEFLRIYDRAVTEIDQREALSDLESRNSSCMLKSRFYFEVQLSKLYTYGIFEKLQDEIVGMCSCFSVRQVVCSCGLFNFRGYLCRHALSVINQIGLEEIPRQYVLERWRKDVERNYVFDYRCNGIDVNNPIHRYDDLYGRVVKVSEEGRRSRDRYKFGLESLDEILSKVRFGEDYVTNSS